MTWVRRAEPLPVPHDCDRPQRPVAEGVWFTEADGEPGDLWRCDDCRQLWRVVKLACNEWYPATRWQRLRYRDRDRGKVATPPANGAQVMSTRMADGYDPPSASLNPQAYRPEKIRRGGQVPAPNAKEPPARDRVPAPPQGGRR